MARDRFGNEDDQGQAPTRPTAPDSPDKWCSYRVGPGERTCPFLSSIAGARGLCSWHARVRTDARNTFEEFEDWCLWLYGTGKPIAGKPHMIDAGYCCVWTHWTPKALWDVMHHRIEPGPPGPCRLASCRNALEPTPAWLAATERALEGGGGL